MTATVALLEINLHAGLRENQAIVGILSTRPWHHQFIRHSHDVVPLLAANASVLLGDSVSVLSYTAINF